MKIKVGNTPLVELKEIEKSHNLKARLFAKVESFNPSGSVKDRAALFMIEDAIEKGLLKNGGTIIEPTSGNTGIGIAYIAKELGFKAILVMPETMSIERRQLIQSYGAQIVLTPGSEGMKGTLIKANELLKDIPNSFMPMQFDNPANVKAHYKTTGPEIYDALKNVDIFVAGVGTGGTVTGVGRFLKEKNPNVKVVAVEPASSPLLTKGQAGPHKIQGIGANFVPSILDLKVVDEILTVENDDAFKFGREVREKDNLSVGISSGAALSAAIELAKRPENEGKNIVIIFPDGGDRYFSTPLFTN